MRFLCLMHLFSGYEVSQEGLTAEQMTYKRRIELYVELQSGRSDRFMTNDDDIMAAVLLCIKKFGLEQFKEKASSLMEETEGNLNEADYLIICNCLKDVYPMVKALTECTDIETYIMDDLLIVEMH